MIPNYTPVPNRTCPSCGSELQVVTKRNVTPDMAHPQFIACKTWPKCNYKRVLTPEIVAEIEALPKPELIVEF